MSVTGEKSLLQQLRDNIPVDAETLDLAFIQSLPIKIVDCASNPYFMNRAIQNPANADIVEAVISQNPSNAFEDIYPSTIARIHARVLPYISGKVIAHVYASTFDDSAKIVKCAQSFVAAWKQASVPLERVCVKVLTNGAGAAAAAALVKAGIPVSCNNVFSLPQAIAAQQAGAESIHLYFNNPFATNHREPWSDVPDPALQHVMSCRHLRIRQIYDKLAARGQSTPLIKTSAFRSPREVTAVLELGADHVTVIEPWLRDMATSPALPAYRPGLWHVPVYEQEKQPEFAWEAWKPVDPLVSQERLAEVTETDCLSHDEDTDWFSSYTSVKWLEEGRLDKYIEQDSTTRAWLGEKVRQFREFEANSRLFIAEQQKRYLESK